KKEHTPLIPSQEGNKKSGFKEHTPLIPSQEGNKKSGFKERITLRLGALRNFRCPTLSPVLDILKRLLKNQDVQH
ncbi:MAG TPA: hypothetical protein PK762_12445, partial [Candidatus Kapabacteria bacterium]|nr:hypothetical protein [Candidatus Kapabacteria bacterium]